VKRRKLAYSALGALAVFTIFVWLAVFSINDNQLKVFFFDIGQGDAILFKKGTSEVLIDGGPSKKILEKLGDTLPFFDKKIEVIVLTHPDADHLRGLIYVLRNFKVENVITSGAKKDTQLFGLWREELKKENAKIYEARAGDRIEYNGLVVNILSPDNFLIQNTKRINNSSIVAKIFYGKNSFLMTGDIEKGVEKSLVENGFNLEADILKVAHHGSKTSSAQSFIDAVQPKYAIISVGKDNKVGHPSSQVLEKLMAFKILRTDKDGDIVFISDGQNLNLVNNDEDNNVNYQHR